MKTFRIFISFLLFLQLVTAAPFAPTDDAAGAIAMQKQIRKIKDSLIDATVAIQLKGQAGSGSGVIISEDGLIMTAAHVIQKPGTKLLIILSDGSVQPATTLGVNQITDAGFAQIDAPGPFPFCPHAKQTTYKVNDWTLALGHPSGPLQNRPPPIRMGRISFAGTTSGFDAGALTTDCTVITGDSGGPLFNLDGEVIGIHSNIGNPWNINNHVPIACFNDNWDDMLNGQYITRENKDGPLEMGPGFDAPLLKQRKTARKLLKEQAEAGNEEALTYQRQPYLLYPHEIEDIINRWGEHNENDASLIKESFLGLSFNLTEMKATLATVTPNGPADKAGMQPGDVILSIEEKSYTHLNDLIGAIRKLPADKPRSIKVLRNSNALTLQITPSTRYARRSFNNSIHGELFEMLQKTIAQISIKSSKNKSTKNTFKEFAKPATDSVVEILSDGKQVCYGTVVSENGEILTKASTLGPDSTTPIYTIRNRGEIYPARLISKDKNTDLALLHSDAPWLKPIQWSDTEATTGLLTASAGVDGKLISHGAVSRPQQACPEPGEEKSVFAKSSSYLGVAIDTEFNTTLITRVTPSSPAAISGIREGDIITGINGHKVSSRERFIQIIGSFPSGKKITLALKRGDKVVVVTPILVNAKPQPSKSNAHNKARDKSQLSLSKKGGPISNRRHSFPLCIFHDSIIHPKECGSPLLGLDGKAYGINIARNLRYRSLAIPASLVKKTLKLLRTP